jgi:pyruvate formate lyase activating enzyme
MTSLTPPDRKISRRELLRALAVGICSLCLPQSLGCTPKAPETMPAPKDEPRLGWFQLHPSPWFTTLNKGSIRCTLCPKACVLADGERSPCGVRENRDGAGYTLVYGNPALIQEDPIERSPFYHVEPASRVLSISTAGCNLACKFCEVWDMAQVTPEEVYTNQMSPTELVQHAKVSGVRAINYTFGEPVVFYEYMMDVAALAKEAGLLNLVHTAGFIQTEPLQSLCKVIDAANIDLKSFDPVFYREVVGGEIEPVLMTLKHMRKADVHLEITNLVIPTLNDDIETIRKMCTWIVAELGTDTPLHFSRFYPLYKLSALPRTPVSMLDQARDAAIASGLKYVYIAKVIGHEGENTICPTCRETVIKRVGFVVEELQLENGRCTYCHTPVPGRWA